VLQRRDHARLAAAAHEHAVALEGERELALVDRADTLPTSCRASRADKAVAHSEKACSCSMLNVEAKGGGKMHGTKSSRRCWCCCASCVRERSTIEDVVDQL
jgi:hypothetical protein